MRPIDADKSAERFKASPVFRNMGYEGNFLLGIVLDLLGNAPALDVLPREEVDHLRHTLDSYALQYGTVKDQHAVIDRIKAETAREIFEEIKNWCSLHHEFNGTQIVAHIDFEKLAELKKKYTEEGK